MQVKKSNRLLQNKKVKESRRIGALSMKKISFAKDMMVIHLDGDRLLSVPLAKFPDIRKLSASERKSYHIAGGISLDFEASDEVYHLKELMGID